MTLSARLSPRIVLPLTAACMLTGAATVSDAETLTFTTSRELWHAYTQSPQDHPNIPDVSYAGYRYSERPLPAADVVANVREHGARGDGRADDSDAFDAAIAAASEAGGGAIFIPAGTYRLTRVLALNQSNLVLRGAGPPRTTLRFERPINELFEPGRGMHGSWYGGLIWIEPDGPQVPFGGRAVSPDAIAATGAARMGQHEVGVRAEDAARLAGHVGRPVKLSWRGDMELAWHIAGHESMRRAHFGNLGGALRDGVLTWHWVNEIESVEDDRVRFRKPLRLDVREGWTLKIDPDARFIEEVGVEHLSIRFPQVQKKPHLQEDGYNAIMLSRAVHCWVRNVWIEHADNGIIVTNNSANNTLTHWRLMGRRNHHGTMCRAGAHDNLFEHFLIESRPDHGLNTEGLSSGNVWRRGVMRNGTFDSHGMMSFDSVRTVIEVRNTGGPGGRRDFGPFNGRRMVHWNINVTNDRPDWITQPALMPSGAIVGIRGAPLDRRERDLWLMPDGLDKGCVVADMGRVPVPPDLFEAQRRRRLGR